MGYSNFTAEDIPLCETITGGVISNAVATRALASSTHNGVLGFSSQVAGGPANGYSVLYGSLTWVSSITSTPLSVSADYLYCGDIPLVTSLTVRVAGRLLTKTVAWDYANSRPLSVAYNMSGVGGLATYGYQYATNVDRIAKVTLPDNTVRTYAYDPKGQLRLSECFLADGVTPVPGMRFSWDYDGIGNVVKAGPSDETGRPRYSFTCDDRNVHISRAWGRNFEITGTAVADATVKVGGRVAQRLGERFFAVVTVGNEAAAIRTNIVVMAFRHDPVLDKDVVACVTGVLSVAKSEEAPGYDGNAAMVSNSRFTYTWDAFGRLTGAVNEVDPKTRLAFAYYPDGRRANKTVYRLEGSNWIPVRSHQFFYDDWNLASETVDSFDATGTLQPAARVTRRFLWGLDLAGQRSGRLEQEAGGIGGLLAFTVTSNNVEKVYLPVADAMGNIHKIVDAATGEVVAEYGYDPYGKPVIEAFPNSSIPAFAHFPLRFQSKYYDTETGLYYFGYRYYDPASCKWLCRDPLQEQGGINLTAYCNGDPVNKLDPLGLDPYSVINETSNVSMSFAALFPTPERKFYITKPDVRKTGYTVGRDIGNKLIYRLDCNGATASSLPEMQRIATMSGKTLMMPLPPQDVELGVLRRHYVETGQFDKVSKVTQKIQDEFEWKLLDVFFALETAGELATLRNTLGRVSANVADDVAVKTLATGTDEAVFWSGIRKGDIVAARWASVNSGATLESTMAARGGKLPPWDASNLASVAAWRNASTEFAAGARGNVRVLQADKVRLNSVWAEVEYPALKANPNVSSITAVNPETGEQILLWSR
jgi:RHS repeat-associated protein